VEAAALFSRRHEERAEPAPLRSSRPPQDHRAIGASARETPADTSPSIVNWERCRYDWSQPGSVKATVTVTVTDSNVYAFPGSTWEIKATSNNGGSQVEII
jgi:hypothetical protein